MCTTSLEIKDLAAALCKAQSSMTAAKYDGVNPYFSTKDRTAKYATLAQVWESCRKPLTDNGLSVVQPVNVIDGGVVVRTRLIHSTGQYIESELLMPVEKKTAQSVGSAITYGRRYGLAAMVGVVADDDDDGNAATEAAPAAQKTAKRTATNPTKAQQVAAQHGMKTGDQLPGAESAADVARKSIDKAVADRNADLLAKIEARILERHKEGLISEADYLDLVGRLATAGDKLLQPA